VSIFAAEGTLINKHGDVYTPVYGDTVEFVLRYMANNTWLVVWIMAL
jgi:hypothetical protein